ncbi:TetR/AcrR family transcriptional regulator [Brachybacterium endophyticum]|uniref:TetR/AcrR family transcriptional regulator n=2 Tax=Brachybacterium endophyticum TaxID=2182385 RepID=A0A2U2RHU5_9MICO|nr:TetR/AcrR family transcriptional regulator [Brachybacterium endophyticum]
MYAEKGPEVPMRAIAQAARVGIATLYRHFPTPDDLLVGVLGEAFSRVAAITREHLECWDDDPARAWTGLVRALGALEFGALAYQVEARVLSSSTLRSSVDGHADPARALVSEACDRARREGLLDEDVSAERFFSGLAIVTRPLPHVMEQLLPDQRAWLVDTYIRGLRPADRPA